MLSRILVTAVMAALWGAAIAMLTTRTALPVIPYTMQQPLCRPLQAGQRAIIKDGRHSFQAVCRQDGPIWTWNAS